MSERFDSSIRSTKMRISSSISRAPRFYGEILNPIPGPGNYHLKERSSNMVKFAVSRRTALFQVPDSPSPGEYNIPSCFDKDKAKSYSFSPKLSKSTPKYPGPGAYNVPIIANTSARPVFGKEKRKDNFLNMELVKVPGPGKYSFHSTLQGPNWRFGTEASRKKQEIEDFPGPGTYEIPPVRENIVFKFPSGRKPEKIPKFPGPGQYTFSAPKSPSFSMPRAEKFQKISGKILPGPSDYYRETTNLTPKSTKKNPNYERTSGNTAATINSSEVLNKYINQ